MTVQPISLPAGAEHWQLPLIKVWKWVGKEPPERHFIVDQWLAAGSACIFVGEDGVGKSLLAQQLVTSRATGKPFLGLELEKGNALYITCEDDESELWRRQRAINAALGLPIDGAPALLSSLRGTINVALGLFDQEGNFVPGPVYHAIAEHCRQYSGSLVVIDNLAHTFAGNENVRREVAAFCAALDTLASTNGATIVMIAHPSKGGAEYSGSTGWSAHVRQRWFMDRVEGADRNARVLRKSKANYAEDGTEIAFRWHNWAFVRDEDLPADLRAEIAAISQANAENARFLECLAKATEEKRATSPNRTASNYAPRMFATMTIGKGITQSGFEAAMERLLHLGAIRNGKRVYQRDNRAWVTGIGFAPTLAPTPAQTIARECSEPQRHEGESCTNLHALTLPYINISGRGLEGPPPNIDDIDWGDQSGGDL